MPSGQTHILALLTLPIALAAMLGSCTTFDRGLVCTDTAQCLRDGVQGSCVEPGHCAFEDGECASGLRWDESASDAFAKLCVKADDIEERNACGGLTVLSTGPGEFCGLCNSGMTECSGQEAVACMGEVNLEQGITQQGSVSASAEFDNDYLAIKAADLDESTSWFSSGPEAGPTTYTWVGPRNDCFTHIKVVGNGGHENVTFQANYGFGEATVQVLNSSDEVVFSEVVDLSGTPDPTIDVDPNAVGNQVKLLFSGHESNDCGGFGELYVTATR